jgi:hypothetical protein
VESALRQLARGLQAPDRLAARIGAVPALRHRPGFLAGSDAAAEGLVELEPDVR